MGSNLQTFTIGPAKKDLPATAWHLVYTEPQAEWAAARRLMRQGFDVFLPCWTYENRRDKKRTRRVLPLFPSYVFVEQPRHKPRFAAIAETRGVVEIVDIDGEPLEVPARAVLTVVRLVADDCIRLNEKTGLPMICKPGTKPEDLERYEVGETVRVSVGVFASFNATVESIDRHRNIKLLVHIFGRPTPVTMGIDDVEKV